MVQIESPLLVTPKADFSSTVSPWLDELDSSTPTRTPEATVSNWLLLYALHQRKSEN